MRSVSLVAVVLALACSKPPAPPPAKNNGDAVAGGGARAVVFAKDNPRHDVFEGPSFKNACAGDGDCKVGGCSGEICTSEEGVNSACMAMPDQPRDATCGCVHDECVWYRAEGAAPAPVPAADAPAQGAPCPEGKCAAGLTCVSFYGIAGMRGGKLTSCEIPCPLADSKCPDGQKCVTIADGPGRVCRPI